MSSNASNASITVDPTVLAGIVADAVATALASTTVTTAPEAPAKKAPAKKAPAKRLTKAQKAKKAEREAKSAEFVGWLHQTAEQRAERKSDNAALSGWCREKGLTPQGEVWALVKDGCADMRKLRAAQKRDDADRAARKAERDAAKALAKA